MKDYLHWKWRQFREFSTSELYAVLALRQQVFVVEQNSLFVDPDGRDQHSWHLLGLTPKGSLGAYLRVVAPGARFAEPSIGRVVVHPDFRHLGVGRDLMAEGIRKAEELYPDHPLRISAQTYLEEFYERLGFRRVRDPYDEDGILHIDMIRTT